MTKIERMGKGLSNYLFSLFTINVFGKIAFSAVTVEIVAENIMTKTEAGLVNALFWLLYGVGQCFGGYVAERVNPYLLMKLTFFLSFVANSLIFIFDSFYPILIIWSLNGLFQFGLWPAIIRVVANDLPSTTRDVARAKLAYSFALGSILSYLLTSLILLVLPWQYMFFICSLVNLLSVIAVILIQKKYEPMLKAVPKKNLLRPEDTPKTDKVNFKVLFSGGIIIFTLLIFIRNIVENCIKTWMPTILVETYDADTSFTLALSVIMMIASVIGVFICLFVYKKFKRNESKSLLLLGLLCLPVMLLTLLYASLPLAITTVCMIFTSMLLYASGQLLLNYYPAYFYKWGLTSFVGGLVNAFAAFGNVVATYGGGWVADNFEWNVVILLWNVFLVAFILLAFLSIFVMRRFISKYKIR